MADSDSSEDSVGHDWIFYKERKEWSDITPVQQDDGQSPVVQIAYSEKFQDVYDYFRAILKSQEKSERALELTRDAVMLNAANYTVWYYRRLILKHLSKNLNDELGFISKMIRKHPKNYQVWHHRLVIVEWLQDSSEELNFTAEILALDAKNYHAWEHRQWVIRTFNLWKDELAFVDSLIQEDLRNNSAWNQRYFVISNISKFTDKVLQEEIDYCLSYIKRASRNESPWNYLRGILLERNISQRSDVVSFCNDLFDSGDRSPYLLGFIIELHEDALANGAADKISRLAAIAKLCQLLATEVDPIRAKYWEYINRSLNVKYNLTQGDN